MDAQKEYLSQKSSYGFGILPAVADQSTLSAMSPVLDGATDVGVEVTAAEGARDGTGVAVDNIQC
jgi:hypothetical protein